MRRNPLAAVPDEPRQARVVQRWRETGFAPRTIRSYLMWLGRFRAHCACRGVVEDQLLTLTGVSRFARAYAIAQRLDPSRAASDARVALHTWASSLRAIGVALAPWAPPPRPLPFAPLVEEYCRFRRKHRGVTESTLRSEGRLVRIFLVTLRRWRRPIEKVRLGDIDRFVADLAPGKARGSIAVACSVLRCLLRFLHATSRLSMDLSSSVVGPPVRAWERPPRFLPWQDVRRILRSVDRSTPLGRRDYALLLLMASYGMGAGEALRLRIDDIDWKEGTLRVLRPKTGVEIHLPLLAAVGQAIAAYLRRGRPRSATGREIFVRARAPYRALACAAPVRQLLHKHAARAGVSAPFLGSHVLRHSFACRQIEGGASPKTLGDILGHTDPASTSVYVRVDTRQLRAIALPVPR